VKSHQVARDNLGVTSPLATVVFTDSESSIRAGLPEELRSKIKFASEFVTGDFLAFGLMRTAKVLIISNSNFSWWAAKTGSQELVTALKPFRGQDLKLPQY
jgi:hypothetical protein